MSLSHVCYPTEAGWASPFSPRGGLRQSSNLLSPGKEEVVLFSGSIGGFSGNHPNSHPARETALAVNDMTSHVQAD